MTQKLCDKAVDIYCSTIKFVSECFLTQEMCDKNSIEQNRTTVSLL